MKCAMCSQSILVVNVMQLIDSFFINKIDHVDFKGSKDTVMKSIVNILCSNNCNSTVMIASDTFSTSKQQVLASAYGCKKIFRLIL